MIIALTYLSLVCGGLLVLILLLGIIGGLDLDVDLDFDSDTDTESGGGVGIIKGGLAFLSIGSWTVKLLLVASTNPVVSIVAGVAAGAVAVYLMTLAVNWMLGQEENVNWTARDAVFQPGQVYLRIPSTGRRYREGERQGRHAGTQGPQHRWRRYSDGGGYHGG